MPEDSSTSGSILEDLESIKLAKKRSKILESNFSLLPGDYEPEFVIIRRDNQERYLIKVFNKDSLPQFKNELITHSLSMTEEKGAADLMFPFHSCLQDGDNNYIVSGPMGEFKPLSDSSLRRGIFSKSGEDLAEIFIALSAAVESLHHHNLVHGG